MKNHLIILCALVLLICPVFADSYSFQAPADKALEFVEITGSPDVSGSFTITQANGDITSGTFSYSTTPVTIIPIHTTVTLAGSSDSSDYIAVNPVAPGHWTTTISLLGNATDSTTMIAGVGQIPNWNNAEARTSVAASPIVGYSVTSDQPVSILYNLVTRSSQEKKVNPGSSDDVLGMIKQWWDTFWGVFLGVMYWLKLLFVDNLILVVTLYFAGTMAYAANTSRNIFQFYKTWFRQQERIFRFMLEMFTAVVTMVTSLFNTVFKWI